MQYKRYIKYVSKTKPLVYDCTKTCCDFIRYSPNFYFTVYPQFTQAFVVSWNLLTCVVFAIFKGVVFIFVNFLIELVGKINRVNKHQAILRLTHVVELETNSNYQLSKHFSDKMMIYCWKKNIQSDQFCCEQ